MADESRRLVAVLFTDIVAYTAAMGRDERRAIEAVSRARATQRTLIERRGGRWIQTIGDGVLCTFESAVDAAECALEIQRRFAEEPELRLRIGIHVGDVVFRTGDPELEILGDGVNVASRIHALAEPGEICVSERVADELRNHPELGLRSLGVKRLKNVDRPVRAYALLQAPGAALGTAPATSSRIGRRQAVVGTASLILLGVAALWVERSDSPTPPAHPEALASAEPVPVGSAPPQRRPSPSSLPEPQTPPGPPTPDRTSATGAEPGGEEEPPRPESSSAEAAEPRPNRPTIAEAPMPVERKVAAAEGSPPPTPSFATPAAPAPERPAPETAGLASLASEESAPRGASPAPEAMPRPPAPGPREMIEETIAEILEILRAGRPTRARLRRIEHLAYARFDLETFSRLVLGPVNRRPFEADCECSAALFVIHDSVQAISLLYPSGGQQGRLAPSVRREVVAVPRSKADAAEGVATEILLLLVSPEAVPLPFATGEPWVATPKTRQRLEELQAFLLRLRQATHDSTVAYLRIVE